MQKSKHLLHPLLLLSWNSCWLFLPPPNLDSLQMTDFVPPVCKVVNVNANDCPKDTSMCESHNWELVANVTDQSGIDSLSLRQGSGNLTHSSLGEQAVQVDYKASCCSPILDFAAVDKAGNVGKCSHSIVSRDRPVSMLLLLFSWSHGLLSFFPNLLPHRSLMTSRPCVTLSAWKHTIVSKTPPSATPSVGSFTPT